MRAILEPETFDTDGYTPWPERKPRAQLFIALFNSDSEIPATPDWARVVVDAD